MKNGFFAKGCVALALFASASVWADMTPIGLWNTVDDNTKEVRALIQIVEKNGVLVGTILKSYDKDTTESTVCEDCKDDRKGKPIIGMEIIRGVKKEGNELLWAGGGKILDPEEGKEYTVRLVPQEEGKKLRVRGYIGPFYRTQIWLRTQ
jgi:uncharacterized protein (DUF2147 family)